MAKSPFDEAKPKTQKAKALERERAMAQAVLNLMEVDGEETMKRILSEKYGLNPGSPRFEAAMAAWRDGKS
jgi:hypothetical protein